MFALFHSKFAHLGLAGALALAATLLLAVDASAEGRITRLSGTIGFGQLAGVCGRDGGKFGVEMNGSYRCDSKEGQIYCDAKGNCTSNCTKCPAVKRLNGSLHPPPSAGAASSAGGAATKRELPVANLNHPAVINSSGNGHSNTKH